jgi:hypothetical protein
VSAGENLRYIRETMERAGSFTAVPGWGGVLMGATALGAALVAARPPSPARWLGVWLAAAVVAFAIGLAAMARKARRAGISLLSGPARKFAFSLAPPLAVGALLTLALYRAGELALLPAVWLLLYGVAVTASGLHSVRVVPGLGVCFLATGMVALFAPASWGNALLAVGFGGWQILFGLIIARRHGG